MYTYSNSKWMSKKESAIKIGLSSVFALVHSLVNASACVSGSLKASAY